MKRTRKNGKSYKITNEMIQMVHGIGNFEFNYPVPSTGKKSSWLDVGVQFYKQFFDNLPIYKRQSEPQRSENIQIEANV